MSDMSPDTAAAIAVAGLMPALFGCYLPPVAVVRSTSDDDGSQRASLDAAILSAAVVVGVAAALTRSRAVLVVGGVTLAAQALAYAHAVPSGGPGSDG